MRERAETLLHRLEASKAIYGDATAKLELLRSIERRLLHSAQAVARLHEVLCFLRAYPDDAVVLAQVERMLAGFARRRDLRRFRTELADTGIAGTAIHYRLFWPMARWVARRWPDHLNLDWRENGRADQILDALPLVMPYSELAGFEELSLTPRDWLDRLRGPRVTDATFLVRRIAATPGDDFQREALHDRLDLWYRVDPGPDTPSRTRAKYAVADVVYQRRALDRSRPDLWLEVSRRPLAVRGLSRRDGQRLVDMARGAMLARARDLDVFAYGDPNDVRLVDFGAGLQFAAIGFLPERRPLLHAIYGFLTLKNGVPIGYVLASALFRHAEVAYNTFETYRGGEAAQIFARVLAMTRHFFAAETFSIDPYQLGYGNKEGLASGAWWFYYKLGFRPQDPDVLRVLRGELAAMRANPKHRSSIPTLKRLAAEHVYFDRRSARRPMSGRTARDGQRGRAQMAPGLLPLWNVSLGITDVLAARYGADRERGIKECSVAAARLLGLRSLRDLSTGERQAWERWSPLILAMPEVERWNSADRRALARVVRAKGGRRDSDFVHLFDSHRPLRRALLRLATRAES